MLLTALAQVDIKETFGSPFNDLGELITTILPNIYIIAGIILMFLIFAGGFAVVINAGKGEKEGVAKGGKMITAALVGFLIIVSSFFLIQIINRVVGINIFTGDPFTPPVIPTPVPGSVPLGQTCRSYPDCIPEADQCNNNVCCISGGPCGGSPECCNGVCSYGSCVSGE